MVKIITLLLIYVNLLLATNYNFTETRYSDALNKKINFEGTISFTKDTIKIKYPKEKKSLKLKNNNLTYTEDGDEVKLEDTQTQKIIQYFKILILIHNSNKDEIQNIFTTTNNGNKSILIPTTSLSNYIKKVELIKKENELKQIQLFLQNNDYIMINIHDEI